MRSAIRPIGLLSLAFGCATASGASGGPDAGLMSAPVALTADSPSAAIALPVTEDASHLEVDVLAITGDMRGFRLQATLSWPSEGGTAETKLASVTPYPLGTPGTFVLGVPTEAARALAHRRASSRVTLTVASLVAGTALSPILRVTAAAHWMSR
jgi:hypothetical protein